MSIIFKNGNLFCDNCGSEYKYAFPIGVSEMKTKTDLFTELHKDCLKTWVEPKVDQRIDTNKKAMWWLANGSTGMSSKTMFNCLIGNENFSISFPYDPDDFDRCYKLLEVVPEWKSELNKLKPLCKEWSNLIDNWDELTRMFEQNNKEQWKNYKKIGMYELMEKCIEGKNI